MAVIHIKKLKPTHFKLKIVDILIYQQIAAICTKNSLLYVDHNSNVTTFEVSLAHVTMQNEEQQINVLETNINRRYPTKIIIIVKYSLSFLV